MKNKNQLLQHLDRPVNLETTRGRGHQEYIDWELEKVSGDRFRVSDFEFDTTEITSLQVRFGRLTIKIIS